MKSLKAVVLAFSFFFTAPAGAESWIDRLENQSFWREFSAVTGIYRPSKHEGEIARHICGVADALSLKHCIDKAGNVLVKMPADAGAQNKPVIVLQCHLDMVCQTRPELQFNWGSDKITPRIEDGWLRATGTTLGADNGIGIAAMLDIMKNPPTGHGQLELLFTVDEEGDFSGVCALTPDQLTGRFLLNLDSEESGEFNIGCAGGQADILEFDFPRVAVPADHEQIKIAINGGKGGHSGVDIHHGRANAVSELFRVLKHIGRDYEICLVSCSGGSTDTAIPADASAIISCSRPSAAAIKKLAVRLAGILSQKFNETDSTVRLSVSQADAPHECFSAQHSRAIISCFNEVPAGIIAMSRRWPGNVQTSMNPGVLACENNQIRLVMHLQGSTLPVITMLSQRVSRLAQKYQAAHKAGAPYRPWEPGGSDELLAAAITVHKDITGKKPYLKVVHAGVECGELKNIFPAMQMLSFGPDIRNAHTADEMVNPATVDQFLRVLRALLVKIAG